MAGVGRFVPEEPCEDENHGLGDSWVPISVPYTSDAPELYSSSSDMVSELADAARDSSSFQSDGTADEGHVKEGSDIITSADVPTARSGPDPSAKQSRNDDSPSYPSQSSDWRVASHNIPVSEDSAQSANDADSLGWWHRLTGRPFPQFWQSRQGLIAAVALFTVTTVGMVFCWQYLSKRSIAIA